MTLAQPAEIKASRSLISSPHMPMAHAPWSFFPRLPLFDLLCPLSQPETSLLAIPGSSAPLHHPPHAATTSLLLSSPRWGHCYFAPRVVSMSFNATGNFQEMKQDSPEKSTPGWNHPYIICSGKLMFCRRSPMCLPVVWWVSACCTVSRSCGHTFQPKQGKGLGTKRECRVQDLNWEVLGQIHEISSYTVAATGGQMEKWAHPSQCRDKGGKSSAQRRLKAPAACTGTCLPPAASSSLQPHSTASSQRPNGSWGIPVTEKSTAQSNTRETENKRILTQKTGSPSYSCSSKKELTKLITYFITE